MYRRCLFCAADLGENESIEVFPVGRRLAFDAATGRLWVVCPRCQRWNLTPLEERWEAVETAERLFRGQRLRAQSENIGLAKLRDGTELVRIGKPMRPEFAAWRYGRVFGRRLRRQVLLLGGGATAIVGGTIVTGLPSLIASVAILPPLLAIAGNMAFLIAAGAYRNIGAAKVVGSDGKVLKVHRADLEHTRLLGGDGADPWRMLLKHSYGRQELSGERARRALGSMLASVNRAGAAGDTVRDATGIVADAGAPDRVAAAVARESERRVADFPERWRQFQRNPYQLRSGGSSKQPAWLDWSNQTVVNRGALHRLPVAQRLALEMALHEGTEQAALEGELALLEAAWREAEEVGAIADDLLTPDRARAFIRANREAGDSRSDDD